jgi:RNA polymerase sigma-70 factor (ECF subfamily)
MEIASALRRGDRQGALQVMMRSYGAALYRHIAEMVGDRDLAGEILSQVFMEAYEDLDSFAGRSRCRTWIYGIARHRCLDAIRARRRRERRFVLSDGDDGDDADTADAGPLPPDRIDDLRLVAKLEECLARLAPAVRSAVLLRFQDELSFEEISHICRERPGTLQQRVARALPVLRRCVERSGRGKL